MLKEKLSTYIWNVKQHVAQYHHHKEQMAFGATGIYATGVAAFLAAPVKFDDLSRVLAVLAGILLGGMAFLFVNWQLIKRKDAAIMNRACDNIIFTWLVVDDPKLDTNCDTHLGELLPAFLAGEYDKVEAERGWQYELIALRLLTSIVIVVLFLVSLAKICATP